MTNEQALCWQVMFAGITTLATIVLVVATVLLWKATHRMWAATQTAYRVSLLVMISQTRPDLRTHHLMTLIRLLLPPEDVAKIESILAKPDGDR